ncbi:hypothetical protein LTR29_018131, partial [Friedmanniomyces endolithicus]
RDLHLEGRFIPPQIPLGQRVRLLPDTEPHVLTHRKIPPVTTATEETAYLPNGLIYRYYESTAGRFLDGFRFPESDDVVPHQCTYRLLSKSAALEQFLFRPASAPDGPLPNAVISSQSECPDHAKLDEYSKLPTLPLGLNVQRHITLVRIAAPSIDFTNM